ncbi:uncharacterized protein FTJAE_10824 [Fusarium tjaetaba]|uniref:Ubiquinol-cytochrome-c reductase cytochrome c1 n=1 Tax=Fusarium tjaetaba TaxID=1567544 RepID=A0A8H5QZM2_9HYPO|nr:uncharacterized protein FTJAE_10824 [Fusarium tjaetaba]KAF5622701.1 hypothetical protein FTJAE_10824 [Fusarium tjaetaba]
MGPAIGTQLDERVIYQATKHVFVGKYAKIRELRVVWQSINNNLLVGNPVQQVVTDHGYDAVAEAVLKLLIERVYESAAIASQRFPDLSEPSSVQTAVSTQVEAETTRTEQVTLEDVKVANSDKSQETGHTEEDTKPVQDASDGHACDIAGISLSSLVYLPFPTEHLLMQKLQKVLEAACYEYGVRELSSIMQDRHWDCPEAVELSQWADLLGNKGKLKLKGKKKSLKKLLPSIAQIRHTAVHRLRTDSTGLQRFLADAEDLTKALGDDIYTQAIAKLSLDTQSTLKELAENKQSIQQQLQDAQEEVARQRAELDQKEQDNLRRMEREDRIYCAQAGERLEKAIRVMESFAVVPKSENSAMGGMGDGDAPPISDTDSNLDDAEHFEDCSES